MYTDIVPDTTLSVTPGSSNPFQYYYMDLNHDSVDDIRFAHFAPSASWMNAEVYSVYGNNQDEEILTSGGYPLALNSGSPINQNAGTWINTVSGSTNSALFLNSSGSGGNWIGVVNKFIGLRINVGSQWYYGWARLDVPASPSYMTIKDYAIQTAANTSINAGDQGSVQVETPINENLSVFTCQNQILIKNINPDDKPANAEIYSIQGKLIFSEEFNGNTVINMQNHSPGIYIVRISSNRQETNFKIMIK